VFPVGSIATYPTGGGATPPLAGGVAPTTTPVAPTPKRLLQVVRLPGNLLWTIEAGDFLSIELWFTTNIDSQRNNIQKAILTELKRALTKQQSLPHGTVSTPSKAVSNILHLISNTHVRGTLTKNVYNNVAELFEDYRKHCIIDENGWKSTLAEWERQLQLRGGRVIRAAKRRRKKRDTEWEEEYNDAKEMIASYELRRKRAIVDNGPIFCYLSIINDVRVGDAYAKLLRILSGAKPHQIFAEQYVMPVSTYNFSTVSVLLNDRLGNRYDIPSGPNPVILVLHFTILGERAAAMSI
jgi:hypothetical protein